MNQELEDYMMMQMFADKYGEETFEKAKKIWLEEQGWDKGFLKKITIVINIWGTKWFKEVKEIQSKLIWEIIERERKE